MKQRNILIVDKEPKNLNILENNFSEANFIVDKATSDYEAIKNLSTKDYDIILSEVTGPSIDGFFILEHLQRDSTKSDIPVVFLTQKSDIWNRVKSFKLGAKDYIVKPMHVKEIVARVNMLLKRVEKLTLQETLAKKKFSGRLEDFNLSDLIETFSIEKKTGILTLVSENGISGRVFFKNGTVINADIKEMSSQAAVFKMISWNKGRFSMLFTDVDVNDTIMISNLGLLLEGAKRMEQRDELLSHIPSLDAVVVTTSNFKKILEKKSLSQDLKEFLELFDGERTIGRVIDESTEDELTILGRIAKLSNLGFLHVLRDFTTNSAHIDDEVLEPISSQELENENKPLFVEETSKTETIDNVPDNPFSQDDLDKVTFEEELTIADPVIKKGTTFESAVNDKAVDDIKEENIPFEEKQVAEPADDEEDTVFPEIVAEDNIFDIPKNDLADQLKMDTKPSREEMVLEEQNDPFADFQQKSDGNSLPIELAPDIEQLFENDDNIGLFEHPVDELLKVTEEENASPNLDESFEFENPSFADEESADEETIVTTDGPSLTETSLEEKIQERFNLAKGNILVLGIGEVNRKSFIDSIVGKYTTTTEIGVQNVSSIYHGTAEFKGNHFLNLISFSLKNEFTPLVEYFSQKVLAYILIVDEDSPDWSYINYLLNVFRNKLHKPAKLIFTNSKLDKETIKIKINLKENESINYCNNFNNAETKKIIFSLFI
jgi:DNA-binding response OmpR family regulator